MVALFLNATQPFRPRSLRVKLSIKTCQYVPPSPVRFPSRRLSGMTSLSRPSTSQTESRIKRKPPPLFDLSLAERYPPPDPHDPFAPLWVLRSRTSSAHLIQPQSIYNLSLDRRRQSAFSLQYPSPNWSDDDMRCVISDSEYGRHSLRQSRPRQRSHSMALLTNAASSAFEFPSVYPEPLARPNERSYSTADAERTRPLHVASNAAATQKKIRQFLKPKKLGSLVHPTSHPRVHKGSISGPVLASKPPVMNAFSLTVQTSLADSQRTTITSPVGLGPPRRRRPSTAPSVRVASSRSQTAPLPATDSISQKLDNTLMRSPPTSSVSHSAFIHISYPTPSDQYSQSLFDDAYISPRPAPRPPQSPSTTRLPLTANGSNKLSKHRSPKTNKSKPLPKAPPVVQPEWALPTHEQLRRAASHLVIAESGVRVTFGSLFAEQRTIVIFIRHFWCPLCQDYMSSVRSVVRPDVLRSPDALGAESGSAAKLVVISNGSHGMISKYKQIFRMPFEMYTDPTLAVYNTLGMARGREGDHPTCSSATCGVSPQESAGSEKQKKKGGKICNGGYVKHGTMGGIVMVLVRAIKVGMPLWEKGGDVAQLGGEFVFGPGYVVFCYSRTS